MSFHVGDQVGDYRIVGAVGSGGAGQVFKVEHRITGRLDAMKVLLQGRQESQAPAERFQREIKLQASLNHPNIASVHNAFWVGDELVMVMELVDGVSLDRVIAEGPVPPGKTLRLAVQALQALEYAHNRGITHRDIKPENIMVTPEGTVKLMDFGLAKDREDAKLTQTGAVVGSLFYISPEQARGLDQTDHRADIYSFGSVLYEMVTGSKPFPYNSSYALLQAAVNEDPRPPTELEPSLPAVMDAVILRAMAKDPEERFPSAREFRRVIEAMARNPGVQINVQSPQIRTWRRRSTLEKQSRRQLVFRALFVLLCLAGLLYLGVRSLSRTPLVEEVEAYQREADQAVESDGRLQRSPRYEPADRWELDLQGGLAVSPAAAWLAGRLEEGGAAVWDMRTGAQVATFPDAATQAAPVFSGDGALVAIAGGDNAAHVYRVATSEPVRRLAHLGPVTALAFNADGGRVATASADGSIRVWDLRSGESLGFEGPADGSKALAFSPTGPLLAAAEPGAVRLLGLGRQGSREALSVPNLEPALLRFSGNGLELAGAAGADIAVWDMPARKLKTTLRLSAPVVDLAQSAQGDWVALTLDAQGRARLWDVERQREIAALGEAPARAAQLGPQAVRIAVAGRDGRTTLWQASSAQP